MAIGNRGFAQGLTTGSAPRPAGPGRLPPRTGILSSRDNRLAELTSGKTVTRVHELVDPATCRIWSGHNRDYAALNEDTCADLIESFKAQGRQEVPAIVRRVTDDPHHAFEVVCGARRHWTATWMRTHDDPQFRFLIEARELTDEEAFRIADLENRSRRDLSDYERAVDYARAIDRYYDGSQQRMAERLEVSKSWLSRYLELAKLPPELIAAFGSAHIIGISHGAALAPLLRVPVQREQVLQEAQALAEEQAGLGVRGATPIPPPAVLRRLIAAARSSSRPARGTTAECVIRDADGTIVARGQKVGRGGVTLSVPALARQDRDAVLRALAAIVDHFKMSAR